MKKNLNTLFILLTLLLLGSCKQQTSGTKKTSEKNTVKSFANALASPAGQTLLTAVKNSATGIATGNGILIAKATTNAADGEELIVDPYFARGIDAIPACNNPDSDPTCSGATTYRISNPYNLNANETPVWSLGQWGGRSSIPQWGEYSNLGFTYGDQYKSLTFGKNGELILSVDGDAEFNGHYGGGIGLILSQNISAPGPNEHSSGTLDSMESLKFSVDMQLLEAEKNIRAGYDFEKHAVLFPINFTIQNLNRSSPGYGQYVWFQIFAYGDRGKAAFYVNIDIASKMMIYAPSEESFTSVNVGTGQLVHLSMDILQAAKDSIKAGFEKNYLKSNNIHDYLVGGVNIGYELTGLNRSKMVFSNFSLKVKKRGIDSPVVTPAPTPAPAPEVQLAQGFYRLGMTDGIYYLNGSGGSCTFSNWNNFLKWGGKSDASNVTSVASFPKNLVNYGACAEAAEPAAPVETNLAAGFYRIGNTDGIYYVNGSGGSCVFTSWNAFLRWGGKSDASNVVSVAAFPKNQISYGACQ